MSEVKYSKEHEWIKVEGDVGTIGITQHATEMLGDIVFVELPDVGSSVEKDGNAGVVESTKAASDVYTPISGEVGEAWFICNCCFRIIWATSSPAKVAAAECKALKVASGAWRVRVVETASGNSPPYCYTSSPFPADPRCQQPSLQRHRNAVCPSQLLLARRSA